MPTWEAPKKPVDHVEEALVSAILNGTYSPGDALPGERDLARQLGVTRPTLREVLGRLARDGWLTIKQGKSTRVNDFWREGGPNILAAMVRYGDRLPPNFVTNLLEVRCVMAPAYIKAAVAAAAPEVVTLLEAYRELADEAAAYALFDWRLHHELSLLSGNAIYTLILNGFAGFYEEAAERYFARPQARSASRSFYEKLLQAARRGDAAAAKGVSQAMMRRSIELWQAAGE